MQELRCYELKDWDTAKPALALKDSYRLPQDLRADHCLTTQQ